MINKIKLISPFYNNEKFIERCILSVMSQNYDNFEVLFFDDGSIDNTFEVIKTYFNLSEPTTIKGDNGIDIFEYIAIYKNKTKAKSIKIWKRKTRSKALANWHDSIMKFCNKEDIVCSLDGDDFLINKKVFSFINEEFNKNNIWFMYGGCTWTNGRKCCSMPYNENDYKNLRKAHFKVSQMRNFRAGLFQKIKEFDPEFSCFKDKNGNFYEMACDVALAYPMLEMAGVEKIKHNTKPIYVYNRDNPINDDKVNQQLQWDVHAEILNKKPFNKIKNYK